MLVTVPTPCAPFHKVQDFFLAPRLVFKWGTPGKVKALYLSHRHLLTSGNRVELVKMKASSTVWQIQKKPVKNLTFSHFLQAAFQK